MKSKLRVLLTAMVALFGVHTAQAQITNLDITTIEGKTLLLLPPGASNLVLQSATDLVASNWVAATDGVTVWAMTFSNNLPARYFRLYNPASSANYGMVVIPAGNFIMGDNLDGEADANLVTNNISAFSMDSNLVSYAQWKGVFSYATNIGYTFVNAGSGKDTNHPVHSVDWYDCVKWCNARSQQAGLTPVYYLDAGFTTIYKTGEVDAIYPKFSANGYRLPTEAEWEKASRGGVNSQRFPFGNTISESQANYYGFTGGSGGYAFDFGPNGYNATYQTGSTPYTSPVGSFAPNGYGLCDMCGNVLEWCFDWSFPSYTAGTDPVGPPSGSNRVFRGGAWNNDAMGVRCARRYGGSPNGAYNVLGFRCVARF